MDLALKYGDQDINLPLEPESGATALIRTTAAGQVQLVNALLLWPGVDVNRRDKRGGTALHVAAAAGNKELIELLLLAGTAFVFVCVFVLYS